MQVQSSDLRVYLDHGRKSRRATGKIKVDALKKGNSKATKRVPAMKRLHRSQETQRSKTGP